MVDFKDPDNFESQDEYFGRSKPKYHQPPVPDWSRLIADGDWAVKEYWADWNGEALTSLQFITPERIQNFMAWLVRLIDGEPER